jgi:hypothetical protein
VDDFFLFCIQNEPIIIQIAISDGDEYAPLGYAQLMASSVFTSSTVDSQKTVTEIIHHETVYKS